MNETGVTLDLDAAAKQAELNRQALMNTEMAYNGRQGTPEDARRAGCPMFANPQMLGEAALQTMVETFAIMSDVAPDGTKRSHEEVEANFDNLLAELIKKKQSMEATAKSRLDNGLPEQKDISKLDKTENMVAAGGVVMFMEEQELKKEPDLNIDKSRTSVTKVATSHTAPEKVRSVTKLPSSIQVTKPATVQPFTPPEKTNQTEKSKHHPVLKLLPTPANEHIKKDTLVRAKPVIKLSKPTIVNTTAWYQAAPVEHETSAVTLMQVDAVSEVLDTVNMADTEKMFSVDSQNIDSASSLSPASSSFIEQQPLVDRQSDHMQTPTLSIEAKELTQLVTRSAELPPTINLVKIESLVTRITILSELICQSAAVTELADVRQLSEVCKQFLQEMEQPAATQDVKKFVRQILVTQKSEQNNGWSERLFTDSEGDHEKYSRASKAKPTEDFAHYILGRIALLLHAA